MNSNMNPPAIRVKAALTEYCKAHGRALKIDMKSAGKQNKKNLVPNITYSLFVGSGGVITFKGIGKGNSQWEVEVAKRGYKKIMQFESVESLSRNLSYRMYNLHEFKEAYLTSICREICNLIEDHKYPDVKVSTKGYDEVLWRRAKTDMKDCLLSSDILYQEFTSTLAQQILVGTELQATEKNMLKCLRAAQLSIKTMCEI